MTSRLISKLRKAALAASAASLLGAPQSYAQEERKGDEPAKAEEPATEEAAKAEEPATEEAAKAEEPAKAEEGAQEPAAKEPGQSAPAAPAQPEEREGQIVVPDANTSVYTIQQGDTLWDLSNKFLSSPWYWPKIWSANPYIENPHWIYPGNKLRIRVGPGGEKTAVAEVQPEQAEQEEKREEESPPSIPMQPKSTAPDFKVLAHGQREFSGSVQQSGRLAFVPTREVSIKTAGIVTNEDLDAAGEINASFEEKALLTVTDTAYVKFKGARPSVGATYAIFRRGDPIVHPETKQVVGRRVQVMGEAKVLSVQGDVATIVIKSANEEIERGDLLGTWTNDSVKKIAIKPNTKSLDAIILAAENNDLSALPQNSQVFIDKGEADGVEVGNTFVVHRKGDGLGSFGGPFKESYTDSAGGRRADNPDENVGLLMVVDVKNKVSTALVLQSIRELLPGEHAEMRPGTPGGAGGY